MRVKSIGASTRRSLPEFGAAHAADSRLTPRYAVRVSTSAKKPSQPCLCGIEPERWAGVERDAGARQFGRGIAHARMPGFAARNAATIASFSSGSTLHVA